MEIGYSISILFYMTSAAAYFAYLFAQKNFLHKTGYLLAGMGLLVHSGIMGYVIAQTGRMPIQNLNNTLSAAAWAVAAVFLIVQYQSDLKVLGVFAAPLITVIMLFSLKFPAVSPEENTLLNSLWVVSHVIIIFIGEACFALACAAGILYLMQEKAIKTKTRGFFYKRLPSLEQLDRTGYACLITGFTLMTIGLITGFVYAKTAWGRFFSADPKEVWSVITWIIYAALLHERVTVGWRGRKAAIWSIVGFGFLMFTFFGVNFFMTGHHGEFTRLK